MNQPSRRVRRVAQAWGGGRRFVELVSPATKIRARRPLTALVAFAMTLAMLFLPGTAQVARADSTDTAATAQASTGTETPAATPSPVPSVTPSATAKASTATPSPVPSVTPPATVTSAPEPTAAAASPSTETPAPATTESQPVATGPPAKSQLQGPLTQAAAPAASTPGCGTNPKTGSVDTFMQKSSVTDFANGALTQGLYEGGYVYQRVELSNLIPGSVNVLVFTYQERYKGLWAYDYIDQYSVAGGTISPVPVVTYGVADSNGDVTNTVTLTFSVTADTATIYFAAHIASEFDHGYGTGASFISGDPYHVSLVSLNCASTGSKDNQISASAIQGASVTIIKAATPADGTNFPFHIALANSVVLGIQGTFTLAVGSATVPNKVTYGKVAPGDVTITEDSLPSGWHLSGIVCTGATPTVTGQSVTFSVIDKQ